MKDSRGKYAKNDGAEFPCIKCFTTIDAPMEDVCDYLSNENHMEEYNDLVVAHRDLEDISPHGKICWSQCPQILFIKVIQMYKNNYAFVIMIWFVYSSPCSCRDSQEILLHIAITVGDAMVHR